MTSTRLELRGQRVHVPTPAAQVVSRPDEAGTAIVTFRISPGMRHALWLIAVLLAASPSSAGEVTRPAAAARLHALLDSTWGRWLELHPRLASHLGDHRYDHRFDDGLSDQYRKAVGTLCRGALARAEAVDRAALGPEDRLSHELFERWMRLELEALDHPDHLLPVSHMVSSPAMAFAREAASFGSGPGTSRPEYEAFIGRMEGFAAWVDLAMNRLREGMEQGVVQPCSVVEAVIDQLDRQVVGSPRQSPFWLPVERLPSAIEPRQRERIEQAWASAVEQRVLPAYRRLRDFMRDDYRPACRESLSLAELPGGRDWYRFRVRLFTSTDLEPEEIMRLGAEESRRILAELGALARSSGHDDGVAGLLGELGSERRHWLHGEQAVLERYERLRRTVERRLPRLFTRLPEATLLIRPVEPFASAHAPGAYYEPPAPRSGRPGIFRVRVSGVYAAHSMDALFLHEALPGHHLQLSLAAENPALPQFRRHGYEGAYIEGWALYAEGLGEELGLYRTEEQRLGHLLMDLRRSARLVVDVGVHWFGWTRPQAEQAIRQHLLGINLGELDRYAAMPGQALAYKVGEQELLRLRRLAEAELGDRFELKAFHDEVLAHGALPLDLLTVVVEQWIEAQRPPPVTPPWAPLFGMSLTSAGLSRTAPAPGASRRGAGRRGRPRAAGDPGFARSARR
jgi:uncharacterized protein (DUF885 family)